MALNCWSSCQRATARLCVTEHHRGDTALHPRIHSSAVYRQMGHAVGEALVRKKKESRRSGVSAESGVEKEY